MHLGRKKKKKDKINDHSIRRKRFKMNRNQFQQHIKIEYIQFKINNDFKMLNLNFT